jgi:hypothetical protein
MLHQSRQGGSSKICLDFVASLLGIRAWILAPTQFREADYAGLQVDIHHQLITQP